MRFRARSRLSQPHSLPRSLVHSSAVLVSRVVQAVSIFSSARDPGTSVVPAPFPLAGAEVRGLETWAEAAEHSVAAWAAAEATR